MQETTKQHREWVEKFSGSYSLVGSMYAASLGFMHWHSVGQAFDLIEWGGNVPQYLADSESRYFAQHGGVRVWWSDRLERIEAPGMFIVVPTSVLSDGSIGRKLQAFKEQCNQPIRIRLEEVSIETIYRNFELFVKPVHKRRESPEEWQFRVMRMLVRIFNHVAVQSITKEQGNGKISA